MRDDLLYYYERELTYLRRLGAEFAEQYPKIASRLELEPTKCDDPHVERLLEGFAFLAARVHLKLDDDFPQITDALLNVLYPHYVRPIPAMSMVEFHLDPEQGKLSTGLQVPRDSILLSRPVAGVPCRFRTCYDTTLWPLTVKDVSWVTPDQLTPPVRAPDAVAAVRLRLQCLPDVRFDQLELSALRMHLNGETNLVSTVYELLCNNCTDVLVRDPDDPKRPPLRLPASAIRPVGFGEDEGMLPFAKRSFVAYRLLQEYFTFPEKFYFIDVAGFDQVRAAGFGSSAELVFLIAPFERTDRRQMLETGVSTRTFRLGCTPVVNLFTQSSEPVLLAEKNPEYLLIADVRRRAMTSIYSVDEVVAVTPGQAEPLRFEPFYSYRHSTDAGEAKQFWYATRRPSGSRSGGASDVYLSFVDLSSRPVHPDRDAVTARITCYNGDLPSRLPFGSEDGDFELERGGPVQKIVALLKPTPVVEPPLGKPQLWRLISLLSLNYVSLVEGGAEALRELLRLHNFGDSMAGEKQIQGVLNVKGSPCYSRIENEHGLTFARGQRVEVEFDEEQFAGGGVYLLASVLERFLGLYVSLNSFCILSAQTQQRSEVMAEWPPRAGWKPLL